MLEQLSRNWWMLALRGAFAVLFGVIAWVWPGITVLVLVIMFGAYALVDGAFALGTAIWGAPGDSRTWLVITGVCGILLGIVTLAWPGATGFVLLMLIGAWAVVTGLLEIVAAIGLRRQIKGEWFYILSGAVSVLFGILVFAWPASGALAVIWLIGLFAILFGIAMIAAALRLRRLGRDLGPRGRTTPGGAAPAPS